MHLNSTYLFGIVYCVKQILAPVMMTRPGSVVMIGRADNNWLMMVALYMSLDPEAHQALQLELGKVAPNMLDAWNRIYDMVVLRNQELSEFETPDISELLRRF